MWYVSVRTSLQLPPFLSPSLFLFEIQSISGEGYQLRLWTDTYAFTTEIKPTLASYKKEYKYTARLQGHVSPLAVAGNRDVLGFHVLRKGGEIDAGFADAQVHQPAGTVSRVVPLEAGFARHVAISALKDADGSHGVVLGRGVVHLCVVGWNRRGINRLR